MPDKPLPYTSNAFILLFNDAVLFLRLSFSWPGLFGIVLPLSPHPSGHLDELYPSGLNIYAIVIHIFLFLIQAGFLISLVVLLAIGTPAAIYFAWILGIVLLNVWLSRVLLNRGSRGASSWVAGKAFAKNPDADADEWVSKDHPGEKWVFINGVAVGSHWLSSNLERLAMTFRRPVLAIHNPTYGIIFDVLECVLQRTFGYPTLDIRNAYTTLAALLSKPEIKKLVLIAHSQGAIEAGMVLDWLYATLSREEVAKLEVFTFGNAANHWNCPIDSHPGGGEGPIIKHIEHYANDKDWVARFGILHFRRKFDEDPSGTRALRTNMIVEPSSARAGGRGAAVVTTNFNNNNNTGGSSSTTESQSPGSPASALVSSPIAITQSPLTTRRAGLPVISSITSASASASASNPTTTNSRTTTPQSQDTFSLESRRTLRTQKNRFVGRMFLRPNASGHQMNQHYMDNMFPLETYVDEQGVERVRVADGELEGVGNGGSGSGSGNGSPGFAKSKQHSFGDSPASRLAAFMDREVDSDWFSDDDTVTPVRESKSGSGSGSWWSWPWSWWSKSKSEKQTQIQEEQGKKQQGQGQGQEQRQKRAIRGNGKTRSSKQVGPLRVRDHSRLWEYRNGKTPGN